MIGAIIGDIAGSRFEVHNHKDKNFEIFHENCRLTDDSIMSLAVAEAILKCDGHYENLSQQAIASMQKLGREYPNAGYGGTFIRWIFEKNPQPYGSFGNGAAMRVSPCGFAARTLLEAQQLSESVTAVSHNHPESFKGAAAITSAISLARTGAGKKEIRDYICQNYYDIPFTIDQIRPEYRLDVSCHGSVPVALEAFFESNDFEDAIRIAISVGGDSDTIACMTGAVAEAYYGVPSNFVEEAIEYMDSRQMEILYAFEQKYPSKAVDEDIPDMTVFDEIAECVDTFIPEGANIFYSPNDEPPEAEGYSGMLLFRDIEVNGEIVHGPIHVWVKKEDMVPDFSALDQNRHYKNSNRDRKRGSMNKRNKKPLHVHLPNGKEAFNHATDIAKNVGKVGSHVGGSIAGFANTASSNAAKTVEHLSKRGVSQIKRTAADISDKTADLMKNGSSKKICYCYAIEVKNIKDTETTIHIVDQLKEAGFDARIFVKDGEMRPFIFVSKDELQGATKIIRDNGADLNEKPLGKQQAMTIKSNSQ